MAYVQKLDSLLRFFDGDITMGELMNMDIPTQRVMFKARLENLRRSQEAFNNGKIDAYSRRYASTMISSQDEATAQLAEDAAQASASQNSRSRSRNFHDRSAD